MWTSSPSYQRDLIDVRVSNIYGAARCPAKGKNPREHSPTRKKKKSTVSIKGGAV